MCNMDAVPASLRAVGAGRTRSAAFGPALVLVCSILLAGLIQGPDFAQFPVSATLISLGVVAFTGVGILLWMEPGQRANARLFVLTAALFAMEWGFTWPYSPLPFLALPVGELFALVLGLILLRYPHDRLARPVEKWYVATCIVWTVVGRLVWAFTIRPEWFAFGITGGHGNLPASTWWITLHAQRQLAQAVATATDAGQLLLVLVFLVLMAGRLRRESRLLRNELYPVVVGLFLLIIAILIHLLTVLWFSKTWAAAPREWVAAALAVTVLLIPVAFIFAALRRQFARTAIAALVVRLAHPVTTAEIRAALRDTLGDDTLQLFHFVPETQTFVDADGKPAPDHVPGFPVTVSDHSGKPLAVVYADPSFQRHPQVLNSAVAASAMALENARLEAALRAQLEEVRASRSRIVAASLHERRRMERDLHDGAQQRLLAIGATLGRLEIHKDTVPEARVLVEELRTQLRAAREDLRDLARGLHPAVLSQAGLAQAVEAVAERLPLVVDIDIPSTRWRAEAELTAYFVACEALTNAAKHAGTDRAQVRAYQIGDQLQLWVTDDGTGTAAFCDGGGLSGLRDRVRALGGDLQLTSAPGVGTVIEASLPCG
jgi:signal transduction histidine kinase